MLGVGPKTAAQKAEERKQREMDLMEMATKEAEASGQILTKGQRKELAKELARKMYEEKVAEAARKAKKAKEDKAAADKLYWEEIHRKNKECFSKSMPEITLVVALRDANAGSGKKAYFQGPSIQMKRAKAVKSKLVRERREAMAKKAKEDERRRREEQMRSEGASWQERQAAMQQDNMSDLAADALKKRAIREAAQKRLIEEEKERQRKAALKREEEARRAKLEQDAYFAQADDDTHWYKSGCKYYGDQVGFKEAHGYGEFTWKDGQTRYEGDYFHGRMQGRGKFTFKNGDSWEGTFLDDLLHGFGLYTYYDEHGHGEQRWCFYQRNQRVCWEDELVPGTRIELSYRRDRCDYTRVGTVMQPAVTDKKDPKFRDAKYLVKFDYEQAQWLKLTNLDWRLTGEVSTGVLPPTMDAPSHAYGVPGVDDTIHFSTDRPHKMHLPLIREYFM